GHPAGGGRVEQPRRRARGHGRSRGRAGGGADVDRAAGKISARQRPPRRELREPERDAAAPRQARRRAGIHPPRHRHLHRQAGPRERLPRLRPRHAGDHPARSGQAGRGDRAARARAEDPRGGQDAGAAPRGDAPRAGEGAVGRAARPARPRARRRGAPRAGGQRPRGRRGVAGQERQAMTECPAENTLAELARGGLDRDAAQVVERHIDGCRACAELVGVLARLLHEPDSQLSTSPTEKGAPSFLPRGARVGRLVVDAFLGAGGMGVVYRAVDPRLDRPVALKLLRSELSGDEARARLLREAQAMARLSHPNVIVVYEVGTFGGQTFVAMELVTGQTLRDWLRAAKRPWRAVLDRFVQAGRGLAAAHAAGIVHRDFKPANVLLAADARVRVLDFGLARAGAEAPALDASSPSPTPSSLAGEITASGALVGTPAYMAPEQRGGRRADERSDQYSFCVSLHEGLYGERPGNAPPPTGDAPAWLRRAIARGLAREPSDR